MPAARRDPAAIESTSNAMSFNVRGEPIVCTPKDAYTCFMRTDMDYLVLDRFLLDKKEMKPLREDVDWREQFELD